MSTPASAPMSNPARNPRRNPGRDSGRGPGSSPAPEPLRQATPERILLRLDWQVIRRLDGLLQGDYRSLFYGYGVDFADLREYQPGDDIRYIDWNITARMDTPYIRQYVEDREITAWFLLDLSPSMDFGTVQTLKRTQLIDFVATVARLLTRHGNRVGAILYTGGSGERAGERAGEFDASVGDARRRVHRTLGLLAPLGAAAIGSKVGPTAAPSTPAASTALSPRAAGASRCCA